MKGINRRSLPIVLLTVLSLFAFAGGLRAQEQRGTTPTAQLPDSGAPALPTDAQSAPDQAASDNPPDPSTIKATMDPAESEEPYRHWKKHTGTAQECIASLRIRPANGGEYQYVSALVIRCDGFVLVPRSAFEQLLHGAVGDIVVTGAEAETVTAPFPIAGWQRFISGNHRVDYTLVKVNGHHIRCLPLLSGYNVRDGDSVRIVYSVPTVTASSAKCTAVILHGTIGATADRGVHFALQSLQTDGGAAVSGDSIPLGAAVIDDETGAGLGMVTAPGIAPSFSTFLRFGDEFNEVALAPSRNALKLAKAASAAAGGDSASASEPSRALTKDGMIRIPGGPVTLKGAIRDRYMKVYNTDVACTPDFYIDELPITNGEYLAWLQAHNGGWTLPKGWDPDELANPVRRADLPVTGVGSKDALGYLAARDKRLVTEVEWQRASKVSDLTWLVQLWTQWANLNQLAAAWLRYYEAYWKAMVALQRAEDPTTSGQTNPATQFTPGNSPQDLWQLLTQAGDSLSAGMVEPDSQGHLPSYIHPVSDYVEDISVYGVRDVVLNAPELTTPRGYPETLAYKPYADGVDPYVSYSHFAATNDLASDGQILNLAPVEQDLYFYQVNRRSGPAYFVLGHVGSAASGGMWARGMFQGANFQYTRGRPPRTNFRSGDIEMSFEWHAFTYPEFRGAR